MIKLKRFIRQAVGHVALALGLAVLAPAHAQFTSDIDIYSANSSAGDPPNVLLLLDNTANWNSAFTHEVDALVKAFGKLDVNRYRVGVMMFTESGGSNTGPDGAYIRAASRLLDADHKLRLGTLFKSLDVVEDKSNSGKAGLAMAEAYYYLSGKAPHSGNNKEKADYAGNVFGTAASKAIYALPGNAFIGKAGSPYVSPVTSNCERNYIIFISNGAAQDSSDDSKEASAQLSAAYQLLGLKRGADLPLSPTGSQSNLADEWAEFMKKSPQNVSTFILDVNPEKNNKGEGWTALLKSMADSSGGEYFAVDSSKGGGAEIELALNDIFNQIQSVDSVFSSASLPVSVSARGTYLNQIFMGMFRPDGDANPRWRGNLKQFKFGYEPSTDSLFLSDANGKPAITGATGFISPSAVSFWTNTSTFWIKEPMGTPPSASDSPDGEVVEKGGVAQKIRSAYADGQDARPVFTCLACSANTNLATTSATQFSASNNDITSGTLGVATDTARNDLINWVRGTDNTIGERGPGGSVTVRPSVHGDVLHSRPAVVNYGTTTGVVVFYGSNDGMLRAVNGNPSGTGAGSELWSFIASEHLPRLKRLRDNAPEVRLSTTTVSGTSTATPRDYFVDGPISIYQKVLANGSTEKAILYATMRRGGRMIYALDVTNPAQPVFLWKKTQADIAVLGQTWSEPKVAKVKGHTKPVLIMGAGYDPVAEDAATPGTTTMGNAVLVLDAFTGEVLKQFSTDRSVPADVALVDADFDGFVDRAYVVDLSGSIYRLDVEKGTSTLQADWGMFKLASLNGGSVRKFFYPPDVVVTPSYAAVLAGSGDREKPLNKTSADAFFTVYDTLTSKGTPFPAPSPIQASSLGLIGAENDKTAGCYLPMSTAGEKIVNAPVTVAGITYFGTNRPREVSQTTCSANLGDARVYGVPLFCKAPTSQDLVGGGLPPSPVTGTVLVSYQQGTDASGNPIMVDKQVPFIIGAPNTKGSSIEGSKVKPTIIPVRKRSYWYLKNAR